jgi:hypothetical protein
MAEKVLDGQRLYVDIIEVNPPATMFLYLVPALLARLSGVPTEFFVDVLVFLAVALSLWLSHRILRRAGIVYGDAGKLATLGAVVLLVMPVYAFGEREHIALIAILPLLAAAAVRAKGERPDLSMVMVAGICGGITAIIKPYFVLPIVCAAAAATLHNRSWRTFLAPENWIAAGLLAVYAVAVPIAYPQFSADILPMVLAVYVPVKLPLPIMLIYVATPLWIAIVGLIGILRRRAVLAPPFSLLLAASTGFLLAFYVQQKGWAYQSYPMLALALLALALALVGPAQQEPVPTATGRLRRAARTLSVALVFGATLCWMNFGFDPAALAAAVRSAKPHPKIIALSTDLWPGLPLTRMVGGTWVGRVAALWITGGVWSRRAAETLDPQTESRLAAYAARDKAMFAADVARHRPDVILVDRRRGVHWLAWADAYPPLAAQLQHYRKVQTVGGIDILRQDGGD